MTHRIIEAALIAPLLAFGSVGQANAGLVEDGSAAYDRGDYATALRLWLPLAKQGNPGAQTHLGLMYEVGLGVKQDHAEAVNWLRKAAEQGDAIAQFNLAVSYALGKAVVKDYVYAHMWGSIAASNGHGPGGKLRDDFAKKMTPSQIEKAQDLARECIRKSYKQC